MNEIYNKIKITENDCWEFTGALRSGYGAIKIKGKVMGAHRVSYELTNGDIPEGLFVCHKCDNRKCINPLHLFLGTQKDNMQDCKSKGRFGNPGILKQRFKKNHYPSNTSIPLEKAIEVKNIILNRGNKSLLLISKENNIPYQYVRDISCGKILKGR